MLAELATALRGLGKHAEAQRCCTAAVTARPDYQRGWLELGRAQAAQGWSSRHNQSSVSSACYTACRKRLVHGILLSKHGVACVVRCQPKASKTRRVVAHTCMLMCVAALLVTAASQSLLLFCINPPVSACTALSLAQTQVS